MDGEILIDRYSLEEIVGEGSYSIVFRGYDQQDRKKVAVKELKSAGMPPEEADEAGRLFFNEINILKNLSHPNIAQVYDFFIFQGRQYMVMEWVEGENLEELLKREGKITQQKALNILKQAADALCYLQGVLKRIVYRDFKPSNLIVDKNGKLKIIDFGIARYYSPDKTKDTHVLGTPGYAPPEAYEGKQTDFSSDIYSLGATIHHIITGEDPLQFKFRFPNPRLYNKELTFDFATLLRDCLKPQGERIGNGVELQRRIRKIGQLKKREVVTQDKEETEEWDGDIESKREWGRFWETGEISVDLGGTKKKRWLVFIIATIVLIIGCVRTYYLLPDQDNNCTGEILGFFLAFLTLFLFLLFSTIVSSEQNTSLLSLLNDPDASEKTHEFKSDIGSENLTATLVLLLLLNFNVSFFFSAVNESLKIKIPLFWMVITMVFLSVALGLVMTESTKTVKKMRKVQIVKMEESDGTAIEKSKASEVNTGMDDNTGT